MAQGGRLVIETANSDLDEASLLMPNSVPPGRYVMLAVSDTGCGMDAETQSHIFEPFFTTKGPGKGTGLGLSVVFGIVQHSLGTVSVDSAPGRGTTFRIYFPSTGSGTVQVEQAAAAAPSTGSETILVVEDEEGVRSLIRSSLQRAGYTVLEASNGNEALEI